MTIPFTADLVEGFAGVFISPTYDNAKPTPEFHRESWRLYCSQASHCTIVAPRGHSKSTALTLDWALAALLFRIDPYMVIVSATEDLAKDHLAEIAKALRENDELISHFSVAGLPTDAKTEIVCRFNDGYEFRILAKGSGQKMRGLKWRGRRPGIILGDDLEEDEQVENKDRRKKFRNWFNRALLPCGRQGALVRVHGTILHEDSLLARLQKSSGWQKLFFKAHESFDDFSNLLWPEQFSEADLQAKQQRLIADGDAAGYSQEYLNDPLDNSDAYLLADWFIPMSADDRGVNKLVCCAADFAISKADTANRTSLSAGGMDSRNLLHFVGSAVGRWDSLEICDELFDFAKRWNPDVFWVEDGQIWKAIWPVLKREMQRRGRYINFVPRLPILDKASRGRSLQRRMRSGATRWDAEADWFPGHQQELLRFTGHSEATLDDQFDSDALLSLGFDDMNLLDDEDFTPPEDYEFRRQDPRVASGRNPVTGY